jgi:hypothetical protein
VIWSEAVLGIPIYVPKNTQTWTNRTQYSKAHPHLPKQDRTPRPR